MMTSRIHVCYTGPPKKFGACARFINFWFEARDPFFFDEKLTRYKFFRVVASSLLRNGHNSAHVIHLTEADVDLGNEPNWKTHVMITLMLFGRFIIL